MATSLVLCVRERNSFLVFEVLTKLVTAVSGEEEGTALLTNDKLYKQVQDVLSAADEIIDDTAGQLHTEPELLGKLTEEFEGFCKDAIAANPKAVGEYKAGNAKAMNALIGPVMKASKGKANPGEATKLLNEKMAKL